MLSDAALLAARAIFDSSPTDSLVVSLIGFGAQATEIPTWNETTFHVCRSSWAHGSGTRTLEPHVWIVATVQGDISQLTVAVTDDITISRIGVVEEHAPDGVALDHDPGPAATRQLLDGMLSGLRTAVDTVRITALTVLRAMPHTIHVSSVDVDRDQAGVVETVRIDFGLRGSPQVRLTCHVTVRNVGVPQLFVHELWLDTLPLMRPGDALTQADKASDMSRLVTDLLATRNILLV